MKESGVPICEILEANQLTGCVPIGFTPEPCSRVQNLASMYLRWVPSAQEIRRLLAETRRLEDKLTALWPANFSQMWADYGPAHTTTVSRPIMSSRHVAFSVEVVQFMGTINVIPVAIVSLFDHMQAVVRDPGETGWPQIYWLIMPVDVVALLQTLEIFCKDLEFCIPKELRRKAAVAYVESKPIPHNRVHWRKRRHR